jgi:cell division protein FtsI (penicillin-binding protein 3)
MKSRGSSVLESIRKKRMNWLMLIIGAVFSLLVYRLYELQIADVKAMRHLAESQAIEKEILPAQRGRILDRNGHILATNLITYDIGGRIMDIPYPNATFQLLGREMDRSPETYIQKVGLAKSFIYLERSVSFQKVQTLKNLALDPEYKNYLRGLRFEELTARLYPLESTAGHVLGFSNKQRQGLAGLELQFNSLLRGQDGYQMVKKDREGRLLTRSPSQFKQNMDGSDLVLTIDKNYQIILEEEVQRAVARAGAKAGMGVLMNPNTGEILAMANYPNFNPNQYGSAPDEIRRNRCVTDQYEPGSVYKVVPIAAALEQNVFSKESKINCENGKWSIYNRILNDTHKHEWLSVEEVLSESSNIGAAKIAQAVGKETHFAFSQRFGFGSVTGSNLIGETPGQLTPIEKWEPLSNTQIAMGHNVTVSLLQIAMAYSAIANGGVLLKPYILKSVLRPDGEISMNNEPTFIRRVVSSETAKILREMLEKTVHEGTGKNAYIENMRVAGKTGTAQKVIDGKYSQREYMASFVGFFPTNKPVLVCAITIDAPVYGKHFGSYAAAPAVKNVFVNIINSTRFNHLFAWIDETEEAPQESDEQELALANSSLSIIRKSPNTPAEKSMIQPTEKGEMNKSPEPAEESILAVSGAVVMPDLTGRTMKNGQYVLRELGLRYTIKGSGKMILGQEPKAATILDRHQLVTLIGVENE